MIPVSEPRLGTRELEYVTECVRTGWISSAGPYIVQFEDAWAHYCGRHYGIAVSSGTAALEIAARCLDLQAGDEVIVPTFTIISCAQAIVRAGGVPVLVDADPVTWCMSPDHVTARIGPRTRAIMPVHIYGHPVDMDPLIALARDHELQILEDAAEAHGAEYRVGWREGRDTWLRCGSFGELSSFSFYANKIITTGEGGMVLTDDPVLAARLRSLRNLCFGEHDRFRHSDLGYNFRFTNLQAAIGMAQLQQIDTLLVHKQWMGRAYTERLQGLEGLVTPVERPWARQVYWMYGIVIDEATGLTARDVSERLAARDVMTRPFFLGMHEQPVFQQMGLFRGERYPVAERLARQGLYLPSGLTLTEAQINRVSEAVTAVLRSAA